MNTRTILLVEDNPSDVALTRRALEKNSISNPLVVVEDGQQALDYLEEEAAPLPALVLLDLKLPKVDGLTVLQRLRANIRTRRLPVVVLTSSTEQQDLAASYDSGVNSYIRKPVDFEEFVLAIEQLGLYWLVLNQHPPQVAVP